MSPTSEYVSLDEHTMASSHLISLRKMNCLNLMHGVLVMGSFVGFSLTVWYLIFWFFEIV